MNPDILRTCLCGPNILIPLTGTLFCFDNVCFVVSRIRQGTS